MMDSKHIYHLYRRAAFGIRPKEVEKRLTWSREEVVEELFKGSRSITPLEVDMGPFDEFFAENSMSRMKSLAALVMENKDMRLELAGAWMDRILNPLEPLNERMTLFWANVFVCQENVPPYAQQFNNTLREHALGDFKSFTIAVSKEAAMLRFLNTNRNVKRKPNENFARELMELFTLGPGNYSEDDIKEAARAFTGWNHRMDGSFFLRQRQHDYGTKSFLGWEGRFEGEDIIRIILKKRECAEFICTKVYRYFVNEQIDTRSLEELVDVFYPNYDIEELMRYLFMSDWFYATENVGSKIKSPTDLFASIHNLVPFEFSGKKEMIFMQRLLGQVLMDPPNVAGWEGGRSWIDTNTMMTRMKLPSLMVGKGMIPTGGIRDRFIEVAKRPYGHRLKVAEDWNAFDRNMEDISEEALVEAALAAIPNQGIQGLIKSLNERNKRDFAIQLMSLPEFQLT